MGNFESPGIFSPTKKKKKLDFVIFSTRIELFLLIYEFPRWFEWKTTVYVITDISVQ